jgi:protein-export membrane protein SecD/preprotein translocase SecF subunit
MAISQIQLLILAAAVVTGMVALISRRVVLFRICLILGVAIAAILQMAAAPGFPLRLGLDLRGGTEVRLRLSPKQGRLAALAAEQKELEAQLARNEERDIGLQMQLSQLQRTIAEEYENQEKHYESAVDVVRHRLAGIGLRQVSVSRQGTDQILAQFPGLDLAETEAILKTLEQQGRLEFRLIVPRNHMADGREHLYDRLETPRFVRSDGSIKPSRSYPVEKTPLLSGDNIRFVHVESDRSKSVFWINVEFDKEGRELFREVTSTHLGRQLGIVLDGRLVSAPYIKEEIGEGAVDIAGNFDRNEAEQLAIVLKSGALKARVVKESQDRVGPSLGEDSIRRGIRSMLLGLTAVLVFMLLYYGRGGAITNVALVLNMIILLAVLSLLKATLTLPGIAGLILILGMMVDANVLIFERIREERAQGVLLGPAIAAGYDRAFLTIMDANLTTIIAATFLYLFGSDTLKGFALVLIIGIVVSVFCSLVLTRWALDSLFELGVIKKFRMPGSLRLPPIDFASWFRQVAVVGVLLLVLGGIVFGLRERAGRNYGIDFTGGMLLQVALAQPASTSNIREQIDAGMRVEYPDVASTLQSCGETAGKDSVGRSTYHRFLMRTRHSKDATPADSNSRLENFIQSARANLTGLDAAEPFPRAAMVGSAVATEMRKKALLAVGFAMLALFVYMWVRFRFNAAYGLGAVLALAYDLLITVGALVVADELGWLDGKIDLKIVAALLTIIGYSLNDTIVVFNRIRENSPGGLLSRETINRSINQSLGRTLITSFTTFLVVASMLVLGGDVLRGFSFALLTGIVAGTCSSIFIASPVLLLCSPKSGRDT